MNNVSFGKTTFYFKKGQDPQKVSRLIAEQNVPDVKLTAVTIEGPTLKNERSLLNKLSGGKMGDIEKVKFEYYQKGYNRGRSWEKSFEKDTIKEASLHLNRLMAKSAITDSHGKKGQTLIKNRGPVVCKDYPDYTDLT